MDLFLWDVVLVVGLVTVVVAAVVAGTAVVVVGAVGVATAGASGVVLVVGAGVVLVGSGTRVVVVVGGGSTRVVLVVTSATGRSRSGTVLAGGGVAVEVSVQRLGLDATRRLSRTGVAGNV